MEQKATTDEGKKLSSQMKGTIDRLIEEIRLEGFSPLTLAEQFACAVYILLSDEQARTLSIPYYFPTIMGDSVEKLKTCLKRCKEDSDAPDFIKQAELFESEQLLGKIWELTESSLKEFNPVSLKDRAVLSPVFDYILDRIYRSDRTVFFTPNTLVDMLMEMVDLQDQSSLWDPACGSGSFLVRSAEMAALKGRELSMSGNDSNARMIQIADINAFFHKIPGKWLCLENKDSFLTNRQVQFDYILSNPPVSAVSGKIPENLAFSVPTKKIHLQFLQLIMEHLSPFGTAAVLINENVLFSGMRAEREIRRMLVEDYGLWAVVSLPAGTFAPYTGAKASALIFGKKPRSERQVFFYALEQLGYSLDKRGIPIPENDIPDLLESWKNREELFQEWEAGLAKQAHTNEFGNRLPENWGHKRCSFADRETIRKNEYILVCRRYGAEEPDDEEPLEKPARILERLIELEGRSQELLGQLQEIAKDYE